MTDIALSYERLARLVEAKLGHKPPT
jgi:hypothetical protein